MAAPINSTAGTRVGNSRPVVAQFDRLSYGTHALTQPVIGARRNIDRLTRDELLAYVRRQYTGANVIVGVAGNVDAGAFVREVQAAFGAMPRGSEHAVPPPAWHGGSGPGAWRA